MATSTAADRRARAKVEYNAFIAACPSQRLLAQVSGKWVTLVLSALGSGPDCTAEPGPLRYSELTRILAGISPKMLSQTLRTLERDGLVSRTAMPTVPVTVVYELTDLGVSLHQTVRHLKRWAEEHRDAVSANQERYDAG